MGTPDREAVINDLEAVIDSLDGVEPTGPPADLAPVVAAIDDADVVGLGEASHGTREFVHIKHRLLRHLIEDEGLRLVGLETNFGATLAVNDYVLSGDGTAVSALDTDGIHDTYRTEEMAAFLEWVRRFNRDRPRPDRVRIHGIDSQHPGAAANRLKTVIETTDVTAPSSVKAALEYLATAGIPDFDDEDSLETDLRARRDAIEGLDHVFDHLDSDASISATRRSRLKRFVWQLKQGRRQFQAIADGRAASGTNIRLRDSAMAAQVQWLLDHEDRDRIAIWGHNAHLARDGFAGGRTRSNQAIPSLGQNLATLSDVEYVALGFLLGGGSVTAYHGPSSQFRPYEMEDPPPQSLPATFTRIDGPTWFLNLADLEDASSVARYLDSGPPQFDVAGGYADSPTTLIESDLRHQFDGVVFVETSTPTRVLE